MTTLQRIEAYKFILKSYEDGTNKYAFVCGNLMDYGNIHLRKGLDYANLNNWPEFDSQMPAVPLIAGRVGIWWEVAKMEPRITALRNAINLGYHGLVKEAVNELGLTILPIPMSNCAKILHYMITMNGISCQDRIKAGHRARIADLRHRHGLDSIITKEHLTAVDEFGETYYYKKHYVKPEHVEAAVLAYLRINTDRIVKARKSKVLEAVQDCGV